MRLRPDVLPVRAGAVVQTVRGSRCDVTMNVWKLGAKGFGYTARLLEWVSETMDRASSRCVGRFLGYPKVGADDESVEELRAAWNAGEKGTTSGPHNLNQKAELVVGQAVAQFEGREPVLLQVVDSGVRTVTYHDRWPNSGERT